MDPSTAEFTRQWTATLPKVAAFVGSMVFEPSDRDDVLQDCAVAAMTSFERYDPSRPFAAWAIGVARNQVRLYLRRKSNDPHFFDDEALDSLVEAFSRLSPEVEHKLSRLEQCVARLKDRARLICEYRYGHDMKPAAIARELDLTPNTVAKSLQRIREELRTCMESQPDTLS
ncbi:MAG: sigma-70 family RNA polymerase sigma factor [Akkermansiaceae bacterium]